MLDSLMRSKCALVKLLLVFDSGKILEWWLIWFFGSKKRDIKRAKRGREVYLG